MATWRGREVTLNSPRKIPDVTPAGKKKSVFVKDPGSGKIKVVHFGAEGYGHNYSEAARKSYLARSAKIRDKSGGLTKDDKTSPNYWARRELWAGSGGDRKSPPKGKGKY
jgi:hypothetical protein